MPRLLAAERRQYITEELLKKRSIKVSELADKFDVSTETIRRDLAYLSKTGVAQKGYGGATMALEHVTTPVEERALLNESKKTAIARKAMEYIEPNSVIFLDTGSTAMYVAKLLSLQTGYTIITPSFSAFSALIHSKNTLHMTGGIYNPLNMAVQGFGATNFLTKIKADICILASNGFKDHTGPACTDFADAEAKKIMLRNSSRHIVLADSSKITFNAMVEYAHWYSVDYLITDDQMPEEYINTHLSSVDVIKVST